MPWWLLIGIGLLLIEAAGNFAIPGIVWLLWWLPMLLAVLILLVAALILAINRVPIWKYRRQR